MRVLLVYCEYFIVMSYNVIAALADPGTSRPWWGEKIEGESL